MKAWSHRNITLFTLILSLLVVSLPIGGLAQNGSASAAVQSSYGAALDRIEAKTDARRKELGIPGISLVIVKDDQVIYSKGLGYKDFEKKVPVTPDTQFAIGSATKAFTALSVLMSQDEGKLSLDASPKTVLPYFKINDPEIDKNITIRDLLSHSSGLNRTDLAWISGKLNREEIIRVAGEAKPTAKLRERYQYQNVMFAAAGEMVAKVQKQPWEKFVPEKIFKPLGMNNSNMSMAEMAKARDFSFGYEYNFDTKETIKRPFRDLMEISPAGSINSTARDMAQWLRFVLSGGVIDGKRLVSEKSFAEWIKPQMKISANGKSSYGLGWMIQEWNGLRVVQHGGNIDGFNALVAMIPEKKLGFVMLTNVTGSPLGDESMSLIWNSILKEQKAPEGQTPPAQALRLIAGKYLLSEAGVEMEVAVEGSDLVLSVPGQPKYKLVPTGPRQFKLDGAPEGFAARFSPESGDANELHITQPQGNVTLSRVGGTPAPKPSESAKELIGRFESETSGRVAEIKEVNGSVSMVLSGQPPYPLIDKEKDRYILGGLPDGFFLKVDRDEKGKIRRVVAVQPEGEFGYKNLSGTLPAFTADEMMAKVVDALGGESNWKKLTSRMSTFEVDMENQGVKALGTSWAKAPNKTATETTMTALGKKIAAGWEFFDGTGGEGGYTFSPVEKYAGKPLEDVRIASDFHGLLNWKTLYKKIEIIRTTKCGEEECYEVAFEPEKGTKFSEFYSTKTFLPLKRQGVQASSTSSREIPFTVVYSDYRDVDGVKLPFKTVSSSVSNGNVVTILKEVRHNVAIDDKVFTPRDLK